MQNALSGIAAEFNATWNYIKPLGGILLAVIGSVWSFVQLAEWMKKKIRPDFVHATNVKALYDGHQKKYRVACSFICKELVIFEETLLNGENIECHNINGIYLGRKFSQGDEAVIAKTFEGKPPSKLILELKSNHGKQKFRVPIDHA